MNTVMLNEHFGFNKTPFSISPDPELVYWSDDHRDALANLEYSIQQGTGLVLFSGEVGTGKTTIVRRLLSRVQHNTSYALLLNPFLQGEELLVEICREFSVTVPEQTDLSVTSRHFNALRDFLVANFEAGRQSVVVIDEAQHLSFDAMEQLRLLTNLETDDQKLLLVVFVGQPELRQLIQQPRLRQLSQRITYRPHLRSLSKADTQAYIYCRLDHVGYTQPKQLVSPRLCARVYDLTNGVPRAVNSLLERALVVCYADGKLALTKQHVMQAHSEVNTWAVDDATNKRRLPLAKWAASMAAVAGIVALGYLRLNDTYQIDTLFSQLPASFAALHESRDCGSLPSQYQCTKLVSAGVTELNNLSGVVLVDAPLGRVRVATAASDGQWRWLSGQPLSELPAGATLIWARPTDLNLPLKLGQVSTQIARVAKGFAQHDGDTYPLSSGLYNGRLKDRVRSFQRQHQLPVSGQIDTTTWLMLVAQGYVDAAQDYPQVATDDQQEVADDQQVATGEAL